MRICLNVFFNCYFPFIIMCAGSLNGNRNSKNTLSLTKTWSLSAFRLSNLGPGTETYSNGLGRGGVGARGKAGSSDGPASTKAPLLISETGSVCPTQAAFAHAGCWHERVLSVTPNYNLFNTTTMRSDQCDTACFRTGLLTLPPLKL